MALDEAHAINSLATILHLAGGGSITGGGTGATDQSHQLGQQYLDAATQQASPSTTTDTTAGATSPSTDLSGVTGDGTTVDPVPEGTPVTQPYGGPGGHPGIDLGVPVGTNIASAISGTVTVESVNGDAGLQIGVRGADGTLTLYDHMHSASVQVGDTVKAGQVIGASGGEAGGATSGNSTGAHLHFEVHDANGNLVDPTPWLAGGHAIVDANPSQVTTQVADPDAQMGSTIANILDVAAGKPATHSAATKTVTTPGKAGATASMSGSDSDPGAVDAFLAATRQHESGGDYHIYNQSGQSNASGAYQFLNSTWKGAGGSTEAAAQASPEEQDRVARNMALQLFNRFHSWRLVAIAWYGGPGVAEQVANGQDPGSPDGQGPYLAYGDTIASMMSGGK